MKKLLKEINPKSEKEIEASRKKDISEKFNKIMVQGCEKTITSIKQDQQVYLINVRNRIQTQQIEEQNDEIFVYEDNMKRLYHHIGDRIMNTIEMDQENQKILSEYGSYKDRESLKVVYNSIKKL